MAKRRNARQELESLLPRGWYARTGSEASWVPPSTSRQEGAEYRIEKTGMRWLIYYFAPGARVGDTVMVDQLPASIPVKKLGPESRAAGMAAAFVHSFDAADAAEAHWNAIGGHSPNRKRGRMRQNAEEGLRRASLGKFEGGLEIDDYVHGLSLDGGCNELGDVESFGHYCVVPLDDADAVKDVEREARANNDTLTPEEREFVRDTAGAILFTNSQGLVDVTYFDTKKELDDAWSELEAEYEEYLEEYGEEEDY